MPRHRTFDLGYLANRALVYAFLAAIVAFAFLGLGGALGSQGAFTRLGIGIGLALAFGLGMGLKAVHGRAVRLVDRLFLPHRYAMTTSLDRICEAVVENPSRSGELVAIDVAAALGLSSIAIFTRADDDGFVRQASYGWPDHAAWHVLPGDALCRTLDAGSNVIRLGDRETHDVASPAFEARPQLALVMRRRGRVERAILLGLHANRPIDRDVVRRLEAVFAGVTV